MIEAASSSRSRDALVGEEVAAADGDAVPVDRPGDSLAGILLHLTGLLKGQVGLMGGLAERRPEDVRRHAVHRRGEARGSRRSRGRPRHDLAHLRRADRQRAGLVEEDGPDLAERLDRARCP